MAWSHKPLAEQSSLKNKCHQDSMTLIYVYIYIFENNELQQFIPELLL